MCKKTESNGVSQINLLEAKMNKEYMASCLNNTKCTTDIGLPKWKSISKHCSLQKVFRS